jgi:hypothetical protein
MSLGFEPTSTVATSLPILASMRETVPSPLFATQTVRPLAEIADGSLAVLGSAPVTNGDPETGIVDVPGFRLAVVELADGSKLGLRQTLHGT